MGLNAAVPTPDADHYHGDYISPKWTLKAEMNRLNDVPLGKHLAYNDTSHYSGNSSQALVDYFDASTGWKVATADLTTGKYAYLDTGSGNILTASLANNSQNTSPTTLKAPVTGIKAVDTVVKQATDLVNLGTTAAGSANPLSFVSNIGSKLGNLTSSFQNLFSGTGSSNTSTNTNTTQQTQTQNQQPITNYQPSDLNTAIASDLTVSASRADNMTGNEYRFRGTLSRTLVNASDNASFAEVGSYFGSTVEHKLLVALSCDGSIDLSKTFTTPYYAIVPRENGADVLLSEYLNIDPVGLHCFAFDVDTNNLISETKENNNRSYWREFIAGFSAKETTDETLPDFTLEVATYDTAGALVQDWTTGDITIGAGQELAFRWNAPEYDSCLPLLSSLTPGVAKNLTPTDRNTKTENIDLNEHTGDYEVRCTVGGEVRVKAVTVTWE